MSAAELFSAVAANDPGLAGDLRHEGVKAKALKLVMRWAPSLAESVEMILPAGSPRSPCAH